MSKGYHPWVRNQQEGWAGALALGVSADGYQGTGWKQKNKKQGGLLRTLLGGVHVDGVSDVSDSGSLNDTRL